MKRLILILVCSMAGCSEAAFGSDYHRDHTTVAVTDTAKPSSKPIGTALGLAAAQHQFDFGTYSWQGSAAIGGFDDQNALSFGIARRLGKDRMLLNGSIGIEEGQVGYGAGLNWRF